MSQLQKELKVSPIGLTDSQSEQAVEALYSLLSMSYLLATKTQNYHWNVTGAHFHPLHALFEEQYNELMPAIDEVAERIRQLGYFVPGSLSAYSAAGGITEETGFPSSSDMLQRLLADNECVANSMRASFVALESAGVDQVTLDIMMARVSVHDKNSWMLRSHLAS